MLFMNNPVFCYFGFFWLLFYWTHTFFGGLACKCIFFLSSHIFGYDDSEDVLL